MLNLRGRHISANVRFIQLCKLRRRVLLSICRSPEFVQLFELLSGALQRGSGYCVHTLYRRKISRHHWLIKLLDMRRRFLFGGRGSRLYRVRDGKISGS